MHNDFFCFVIRNALHIEYVSNVLYRRIHQRNKLPAQHLDRPLSCFKRENDYLWTVAADGKFYRMEFRGITEIEHK